MSVEEIRAKAKEFDMKVRRWSVVSGLTFALLLAKNVWEVWVDTDLVERAGDLLMVFALLSVVYLFRRHVRAHIAPSTLGLTNCVEHYRSQLMQQRELSRDGWKYVLPFAPGFGLIIFARVLEGRPASQVAALIVGTLGVFIGVIWVIARGARKLEREIAALD
jgi:ABC-type dipeptide/oligopeptide/nickel transport system permease subunit